MTYKHFAVVFNDEPLESATRWSKAFSVYVDGKLIYEHKLVPTRVFEGVVTNLKISTPESAAKGRVK